MSNFRGSKNRGSMDPVLDRGSGPWTRSMKGVHGPGPYYHGPGPWRGGPCFVLSQLNVQKYSFMSEITSGVVRFTIILCKV